MKYLFLKMQPDIPFDSVVMIQTGIMNESCHSKIKLSIDESETHCWMRMKIKLSPSRLIGLRSPVVSSLPDSTAINCIFSNDVRYNESFRGIVIQLVEKLFRF